MTTTDAIFEQRALHLVRDLLDMEASARETALAGIEPELRARVETLLVWNRAYKNPALLNFVKTVKRLTSERQ